MVGRTLFFKTNLFFLFFFLFLGCGYIFLFIYSQSIFYLVGQGCHVSTYMSVIPTGAGIVYHHFAFHNNGSSILAIV